MHLRSAMVTPSRREAADASQTAVQEWLRSMLAHPRSVGAVDDGDGRRGVLLHVARPAGDSRNWHINVTLATGKSTA